MSDYECSTCGSSAYYDGRCGDGPILMCNCGGQAVKSHDSFYGSRPRKTREVFKGRNGTTVIIISEDNDDGWDGRYRRKNGHVWDY